MRKRDVPFSDYIEVSSIPGGVMNTSRLVLRGAFREHAGCPRRMDP